MIAVFRDVNVGAYRHDSCRRWDTATALNMMSDGKVDAFVKSIEDVVANDYAQDFLYLSLPQPACFAPHDDGGSVLLLIDIDVDCIDYHT